jgi:hypothetical protein
MTRRLLSILAAVLLVAACQSSAELATGSPNGTSGATATTIASQNPSPTQAAATEAASSEEDWTTFTAEDGSFSVSLPGSPLETSQSVDMGIGTATETTWQVPADGSTYEVIRDRFAAGTLASLSSDQLSQLRDGLIQGYESSSSGATETDREEGQISGEAALGVSLTSPDGDSQVVVFSHGDDAYFLIVSYPTGSEIDTDPFFSSFSFGG